MRRNVKKILTIINKFFISKEYSNSDKKDLWNILSAIRGPDSGDYALKESTTAVIRQHSLPNMNKISYVHIVTEKDSSEQVKFRKSLEMDGVSLHFLEHVKEAFLALGLQWDKNNDVQRTKKKSKKVKE